VALATDLADGLAGVRGDAVRLEQAILNLLLNARDAMPFGGLVTVRTAEAGGHDGFDGGWALLAVADTGTGMTESVRRRCFDPYFTTKGARGTGLGLASVERTVREAGGRIVVASRPGEGTTFRVYLPLAAEGPGLSP
jgi:signal transduction histidine kinase